MTGSDTLTGKVALITGASKGIGRAIALGMAGRGAAVAVAARTGAELAQLAAEIERDGGQALPIVCDVTDAGAIRRMVGQAGDRWGRIDILVNNAGLAVSHKFLDENEEVWHQMLDVNLTSVYRVTKAVAPLMIAQQWGRIINIASISSKVGARYVAAYTTAKHGVLGLTRAVAHELMAYNITVNAICPGYVDTPMTDQSIANIAARTGMSAEQARAALAETSPQKRLIEPEEVALVALMLASDQARGITGQAINVDGGAVMY